MIGVIANASEHEIVREFFELFKTPWEFYREGEQYDVLLCGGEAPFDEAAKLVVVYAGRRTSLDNRQCVPVGQRARKSRVLSHRGSRIPVYGDTITFAANGNFLVDEESQESIAYAVYAPQQIIFRIGYNLFAEIRTLLTVGQPDTNAGIPTLELHISLLRELILESGISVIEVPPVPDGYKFIACLTHDVDHPSIQLHKWDHTTVGFLYRALLGSLRNFMRGRTSAKDVATSWAAAVKLPLVHLGLAQDFWRDFAERYRAMEKEIPSTFFVIPFKGRPGKNTGRRQAKLRAAKYAAADVVDSICKLQASGCEVGLHGIDAWTDLPAAQQELAEIRRLTKASDIGIRMHWLCYDQKSPEILEQAGAAYDSTVGYNETVGYLAGTVQVFKPLAARHLLELPMHVMDTALFYPAYLDMSPEKAAELLREMTGNAVRFGGCFTINWHDRSTAPERLWGAAYCDLIEELRRGGAWFATASQAVAWFRKRRSASFEVENTDGPRVQMLLGSSGDTSLPGLCVRRHAARTLPKVFKTDSADHVGIKSDHAIDKNLTCGVN